MLMQPILRLTSLLGAGAFGLAGGACLGSEPADEVAASAAALTSVGTPAGCPHPSWCPAPSTDWSRDLLTTDLDLDVTALTGTAVIGFMPSMTSTGASFDVRGLTVTDVYGPLGAVQYVVEDGRLDVGVPLGTVELTVEYGFAVQDDNDGYLAGGHTFLWPYFCGNLFPCKPETSDGVEFSMNVTGIPEGQTAVYPEHIPASAPSYMPALTYGDYIEWELGTTTAGTDVSVWYLPTDAEWMVEYSAPFMFWAFDFYEQTYGDYVFGDKVGSVSVPWDQSVGGMEHHPYWHIDSGAIINPLLHAHEAAHGWFGNGVRIRCWEDFVLSEGTATYLAARGLEAAGGAYWRDWAWSFYRSNLRILREYPHQNTIVWPDGCNQIELLAHPIWSDATYTKGAFFLRAVEERVGRAAFDRALATFYQRFVGKAAGMADLVATLEELTGAELDDLVQAWLKQLEVPAT
jgi:hypothetical protein